MQQHDGDSIFVLGEKTGEVNGEGCTLVIFDNNFVLRELVDMCFCVTPAILINIMLQHLHG